MDDILYRLARKLFNLFVANQNVIAMQMIMMYLNMFCLPKKSKKKSESKTI